MVVLDKGALTLEDGDGYSSLLILVGGEGLGLLGWDDSTTLDNRSHNTTNGLNTKGKRGDIDEKNILGLFSSLATEDTTLDGSTIGNGFIWVNTSVGFLTVEEVLNKLLDLRNTSGSTNKNNFVDFGAFEGRVLHDSLNRLESVLEKIITELLELGTC